MTEEEWKKVFENENIFSTPFSDFVDSETWNEESINSEPEGEEAPDTPAQAHSQALTTMRCGVASSKHISPGNFISRHFRIWLLKSSQKIFTIKRSRLQNTCSLLHKILQS